MKGGSDDTSTGMGLDGSCKGGSDVQSRRGDWSIM